MTGLAVGLAVAAGLAGAVQAAVMGELGGRAGIFPALAFSGVVSVVIGVALLLIARQSVRGLADVARQPLWLWTGGALSVLIRLVRFRPDRNQLDACAGPRLPRRRRGAVSLPSQRPTMSSGLTGTRVSSRPVAARSAATTAAVETTVGGSPTPFTP